MPFIPLNQPRKATDLDFPRVSTDQQAARDADAEQLIAGEFDQEMPDSSRQALESEYRQRFGKEVPAVAAAPKPRRGFIPLANTEEVQPVRRGFIPLKSEEPERPSVLKTVALENPLTAAGEAALNLGSQAVGMPVAGLAGLATAAGNAMGLTDKSAADVVHSVGDALTYRPRGEMFAKWFDDFAQRHEYGKAIQKAREGMTEWFGQEAIDRARSKIGDHAPLSDALNGGWTPLRLER